MRNLKLLLLITFTLTLCSCESGCDTRHHAKLYRLKNRHIVMEDDRGKWYAFTKNGLDINVNVTWNPKGEMVLPSGGSWTPATLEEEEEVSTQATNVEETTVDETDAGAVDGAGDVGGDSGGAAGDSGGDGGDSGGGDD